MFPTASLAALLREEKIAHMKPFFVVTILAGAVFKTVYIYVYVYTYMKEKQFVADKNPSQKRFNRVQ